MMDDATQLDADPQTLKSRYLDLFRRNREAILDAAGLGFDPPIKGCPGWDVAGLTGHMGRVYTFWLKWIGERPRGFSREALREIAADRDARLPGFTAWDRDGYPAASRPEGIVQFTRQTGDELDIALVGLEPDEAVWTFVPSRQTGAFVFRRLAMETTIHRWDAEEAHGIARPIDRTLALDGIDEMLAMFRDDPEYESNNDRRRGQTVLLREDAEPGVEILSNTDQLSPARRWLVTFNSTGITTSSSEGPADAIVTGSVSDLWLYIMGRRSTDEMYVQGDRDLAASWAELAGRF
jgi:uncharacterized protein (TIGR03083 family)